MIKSATHVVNRFASNFSENCVLVVEFRSRVEGDEEFHCVVACIVLGQCKSHETYKKKEIVMHKGIPSVAARVHWYDNCCYDYIIDYQNMVNSPRRENRIRE